MKIRTVDLFAGGGGLSLGFQNAGFRIVAAFDNWKPAVELYRANFGSHSIFEKDLSESDACDDIQKYNPMLIVGGPPCQDFSSAGKRDESLGRADMTVVFANIIDRMRPPFFLMENVDRAYKSKAFARAVKIFTRSGYGLTVRIIDASLCNVPQLRKRLFVIGEYKGVDGFLDEYIDSNLCDHKMTLREYFGNKLNLDHYYRHPRSYQRRAIFSIDEPSPTVRGVNRPIPSGYKPHNGDKAPVTFAVRPLTTKERSMIQTFPEDFVLTGSKTDIEQIIGNAVPVKLAEYVALRLREYLLDKKIVLKSAFK
jgi:DNA (cytosine-5)-methyltransferase 1